MELECRGVGEDVLHAVVRAGWSGLLGSLDAADKRLPGFVAREVEAYLACGDPRGGFAWLVCADCEAHRLVPFACKGRGFCPTCGGRRMNERAERWLEELWPRAPVRQWVLTVPWARRWQLARHPELVRGVLGVLVAEVTRFYRERAGVDGRTGSVTVVQRFGSALNLNVHFHALFLDGVYARDPGGALRFRAVPAPTTPEVEALVSRVSARAEQWLACRGYGREDEPADPGDDALPLLQGLSVEGRSAVGRSAGGRVRREQTIRGRRYELPPRCASCDGYNLHAGVGVGRHDREGLLRLCRYVNRPPLAKARLTEESDGTVTVTLKRAWSDGTTSLRFGKAELVEKLCALVPPPFSNTVFYHGLFGARSAWRWEVVPDRAEVAKRRAAEEARREARKLVRPERRSPGSRWWPWADLLERVFGVDGWSCPCCGGTMRLRAVVVGPPATTRVWQGLTMSSRGPPP
jgi:hypothetical protein